MESGLAASGGESGRLRIAVGCRGFERFVVIGLADGGSFANGRVLARWDDGRDGSYPFVVRGESLVSAAGAAPRVRLLIDLLRQRNSVELQVTARSGGHRPRRVMADSRAAPEVLDGVTAASAAAENSSTVGPAVRSAAGPPRGRARRRRRRASRPRSPERRRSRAGAHRQSNVMLRPETWKTSCRHPA